MSSLKRITLALVGLALPGCGIGLCVSTANCGGQLSIATETIDFGSRGFSSIHGLTAILTNHSEASIEKMSLGGLSEPFSFAGGTFPGTGGTCGGALVSGASCTLSLVFTVPGPPVRIYESVLSIHFTNHEGNHTASFIVQGLADNGSLNQDRGLDGVITRIIDTAGGTYSAGPFRSFDANQVDFIMKTDSLWRLKPGFAASPAFNWETEVIAEAIDDSGDIYVGGYFTDHSGHEVTSLVRLNSDGTLDSAFDGGTGIQFFGQPGSLNDILPVSGGDIYVIGSFDAYDGSARSRIARIDSNGALDPGFNPGLGLNGIGYRVRLAQDGSGDLYLAGTFSLYDGVASTFAVRVNSDGSRDAAFNVGGGFGGGLTTTVLPATDGSFDVYYGGAFTSYNGTPNVNRIVRLNSNGTIDGSFNTGTGFNSSVYGIEYATDGSNDIFVGGSFTTYNGTPANRLVRLNDDGTVDSSFAIGSGFNSDVTAFDLAHDGSGDILVAGRFNSYNGTSGISGAVRLSSSGTLFSSITQYLAFDGGNANTVAVATDGTGDFFVGGSFTEYKGTNSPYIARISSSGDLRSSFGIGDGFDDEVIDLAPIEDGSGRIYVVGQFTAYQSAAANRIVRLNANGSIDTSFVSGTGFDGVARRIMLNSDGTLYVGGSFTSYNGTPANRIVKLTSAGMVDLSFAYGSGFSGPVLSIVPAGDGTDAIYVGGSFTTYQGAGHVRLVKLNSNGTVDGTFNTGAGFDSTVRAIAPALDGSGDVYVGGTFSNYGGTPLNYLVRLNSNGSVDSGFDTGGGLSDEVFAIHPVPDGSGDIITSGWFQRYKGEFSGSMIRLTSSGDITWNHLKGQTNSPVYSIKPANDGSGDTYFAGEMTSHSGVTVSPVFRVSPEGAVD